MPSTRRTPGLRPIFDQPIRYARRRPAVAGGSELTTIWLFSTGLWAGSPNDVEDQVDVLPGTDMSYSTTGSANNGTGGIQPSVGGFETYTGVGYTDQPINFIVAVAGATFDSAQAIFATADGDGSTSIGFEADAGDQLIGLTFSWDDGGANSGLAESFYEFGSEGSASGLWIYTVDLSAGTASCYQDASAASVNTDSLDSADAPFAAMADDWDFSGSYSQLVSNAGSAPTAAGVVWDAAGFAVALGTITDIDAETTYWTDYFGI